MRGFVLEQSAVADLTNAGCLTIDGIVGLQHKQRPEAAALLGSGGLALTYGELYTRIREFQAILTGLDVKRQDRVAVVMPNGPRMALAFLGVAATAVCAPLNPGYTEAEFAFYLEDLRASAIILPGPVPESPEPAAAAAKTLGIPVIRLAPDLSLQPNSNRASYPEPSRPGDVALVLHTSGTTARPKIVPLTHANLSASAGNIQRSLALTADDRCLNVMPLFHIHGLVAGLLASLTAGAAVVCTAGFDAPRFLSWLDEFQPTWYTAVPTMHQAIAVRAATNPDTRNSHRLRFIRSSSAALPASVMSDLELAFGVPVVEAYGMTEAAHQIACNPLPPRERKPGSVGLAAGPEIAIMSPTGELLPPGIPGEIVIRGENVTPGYDGNAKANAEAFSGGWFRTGDLGHLDAGQYLFISGRSKEIINRGGEKISPREIDEVLLLHPAVLQAVTFAVPHKQLGEDVGAAVVVRAGTRVESRELREFCAARLTSFKVPRLVRFVDEIPKGATGKIQRIGLAAQFGLEPLDDTVQAERPIEGSTALSGAEMKIAGIWADILQVATPGLHDSFFHLGGDSLRSAAMLSRVAKEAGIEVSLVAFSEQPTIAGMIAESIRLQTRSGGSVRSAGQLIPIQLEGSLSPIFCAPGHAGGADVFSAFAAALGRDQPMLAFPPMPVTPSDPHFTISDIARVYVGQLREVQPEGPYYLLGLCMGGFVVQEMARQIELRGDRVKFLGMIDSCNASAAVESQIREQFRRARKSLGWARDLIGEFAARPSSEWRAFIAERIQVVRSLSKFAKEREAYVRFAGAQQPVPPNLCTVELANASALLRHKPQRHFGDADLFRIVDRQPGGPTMGWSRLIVGGLRVHDAPFHRLGLRAATVLPVVVGQVKARLEQIRKKA